MFLWLLSCHQDKLKLVTVLGAGLLCGTALAVIIPEGVHALYEEMLEGEIRVYASVDTLLPFLFNAQNIS